MVAVAVFRFFPSGDGFLEISKRHHCYRNCSESIEDYFAYARSIDPKRNCLAGGAVVDVLYDHQKDPHQLNNLFGNLVNNNYNKPSPFGLLTG